MVRFLSQSVRVGNLATKKIITLTNIFQLFWIFPLASAQDDCDRYCWDSCDSYFPGSEFSSCVHASVHCNCILKMSFKNPLTIFIIILSVMICIIVGVYCYIYRRSRSRRSGATLPQARVVAEPVFSTSNLSSMNPVHSHGVNSFDYTVHHSGSPPPSYDDSHSNHHHSCPTSSDSQNDTTCSAPSYCDCDP